MVTLNSSGAAVGYYWASSVYSRLAFRANGVSKSVSITVLTGAQANVGEESVARDFR